MVARLTHQLLRAREQLACEVLAEQAAQHGPAPLGVLLDLRLRHLADARRRIRVRRRLTVLIQILIALILIRIALILIDVIAVGCVLLRSRRLRRLSPNRGI